MTTSTITAPLAPPLGTGDAPASAPAPYATAGTKAPSHAARRYDWAGLVPFVLCHVAVLGALWSGVTWQAVAVGFALYWARIFGVTAGYHRYFAHRTFETSRPVQFALAFLAQSTAQKGALWWASHHRAHHLYSDTERDLHSPKQHGFLQSHVGWIFSTSDEADWSRIKDFAKYPELVWLNKYHLVPPILLGFAVWLGFGWSGLFIGFFLSTVCTWHGTFCINSLAHVWGKRRFETKDDSRNSLALALITMGEGWHNNHHHYMQSARQGFYWWEIDVTFYLLKGMEKLGLVWNLKVPPARVLEAGRRADAMAAQAR
ncbi:MAG: acyl-CoA desaturase [Myxococcota bacterium]|nr:acyl-CoA desaturase [Myxococcota bacterium]